MRKKFEIIGLCLGWFAVITQFVLLMQNRQTDLPESIIRFFSFFTILTNILVAALFTHKAFISNTKQSGVFNKKGALTAITTFILIVGLVYQFALRSVWNPEGIQRIVDELLHTIIPLYVLVYWFAFSAKEKIKFRDAAAWLLYPVVYILFILARGSLANYYPYPFLNVPEIGVGNLLINIALIVLLILVVMGVLVGVNNRRVAP